MSETHIGRKGKSRKTKEEGKGESKMGPMCRKDSEKGDTFHPQGRERTRAKNLHRTGKNGRGVSLSPAYSIRPRGQENIRRRAELKGKGAR